MLPIDKRACMNANHTCPICGRVGPEKLLQYEPCDNHTKFLLECKSCKASWTIINGVVPVPEVISILKTTHRLDEEDDYKNLVAGLMTQYTNIDYTELDLQIKTLSKVMYILETPRVLQKGDLINEVDLKNLEGIMNGMQFVWGNRKKGVCPDVKKSE